MGDFLAALLIGLVGLTLLFSGYYFARFLIPLWGFVSGLMLGASLFTDSSHAFLSTTLGIISGLVLGLIFAVLAYLYYYIAIVILFGGVGYAIAGSFLGWIGFNPGFITAFVGLGLGVIFGIGAIIMNLPKVTLIVLSAVGGAVLLVGAVLLLFNQIPLEAFSYTTAKLVISNSWFWAVLTLLLAGAGIGTQYATSRQLEFEAWNATLPAPKTES